MNMKRKKTGGAVTAKDYLAIFLVSAAIMLFQISLTRVLSVVVWYHYAFLTISMVMLGLGAPGVWFTLTSRPLRFLSPLLLTAGVATPLSILLLGRYGALFLKESVWFVVACVMPVTLSMGGAVCLLLIKAQGRLVSRMYGVDLIGAGLGAIIVIPLMHTVPTPQIAAATGVLCLIALALRTNGAARAATTAGCIGLVAWMALSDHLEVTHSKKYDERKVKPVYTKWTPTARLTVFDENFFFLKRHTAGHIWGRGSKFPQNQRILQHWIEQDGSAGTSITSFDGDTNKLEHLMYDVTSVGYELTRPKRVAIIGAGGGRDILAALTVRAEDVDAVELNPHIIEIVSERFDEISGDVYHAPPVNAIASEGRSYLTYTDKRYDMIQISLIDSWAASVAGAYALAENNLYTIEAFQLYWSRLTNGGAISISRWESELPRLVVLVTEALKEVGVADPARHIAIVSAGRVCNMLIFKQPFVEASTLWEIMNRRGFLPVYPLPGGGARSAFPFVTRTVEEGLDAVAESGLSVLPPTDNSPYFFQVRSPFSFGEMDPVKLERLRGIGVNLQSTEILQQTMVVVSVVAMVLFFAPFVSPALRPSGSVTLLSLARGSLFFAAIGAGFMLVENMLIQRFVLYLGHPSYATTVILASLLLGMGMGSINSHIVGAKRLGRMGLAVPALLAAFVFILPGIFSASLGWSLAMRITIAMIMLAPLGAVLGLFFPLGMLRFGDSSKPWFWAINGVFGVVASIVSLALSMTIGFANVGYIGAACYVLAWLCVRGAPVVPDVAETG
jgi:hypothetical protein